MRLKSSLAEIVRAPLLALIVAVSVAWLAWNAYAATRTWSGAGSNINWSTPANWTTGVPANNDDLVFPLNAVQKSNNNDLVSRTFNTISFQGAGYTLSGNAVSLVSGITDTGALGPTDNIVNLALTLTAPQTFTSNASGRSLRIAGSVATGGHTPTLAGTGSLSVIGGITGSGGITKTGTGTALFGGNAVNSYTGQTTVNEGALELGKPIANQSVSGNVVVGGAATSAVFRLRSINQIPDTGSVTVNSNGLFDLFNTLETVGTLNVNGGSVTIGTGTLTTMGVTMTGGTISSTDAGKLHLNGDMTINDNSSSAIISNNLDLGGATRTISVSANASAAITAAVSNGGLHKSGGGSLVLSGSNSYSGSTTIASGTLVVNGNQPNSPIQLNDGTFSGRGSVGAIAATGGTISPSIQCSNGTAITMNVNGNLNLSSSSTYKVNTACGAFNLPLTMGRLNVNGTVSLNDSSLDVTISGFESGKTYIIINNDGSTDPVDRIFSGKPEGSSFTIGSTTYFITYRGGDGNDVALNIPTTRTWDGLKDDGTASPDANWMTKENWVGDVAPQLGDNLVFPETAQLKTNTNNFPSDTAFNTLTLSGGGYAIFGTALKIVNGVTDSHASGENTVLVAIGGTGGLTKTRAGTLILSGNHTYSGTTTISAGTLQVDGGQLQSAVTVNGGVLSGNGTVGPITSTGGSVKPEANGAGPLNVQGNVGFSSATTYSPLIKRVESFGEVTTGVNRLNVVGTVMLGGANLAPDFSGIPSFSSGPTCCTFVLISNDGTDEVGGIFNGMPEGSLLSYHGQSLRLSYRGGTNNNDVTLTVASSPTISIDDISANEGNSGENNVVFTVRLSEAIANARASVAFATAPGTATPGSDYVHLSDDVSFNPGATSTQFAVSILGDTFTEADETFFVNLSQPSLATIADGQGQVTILNDDAITPNQAVVQFSASSYIADEGAKFRTINVTRSGDASSAVTVDYETTDGTASDRRDYATALGTLRFAAGETSKTFDVLLTDDGYAEQSETVNLLLSNPTGGAQLGSPATATLNITDNEAGTPSPTNPIEGAAFFVRQQYHDFLNREPDQSGLDFWTNQITQCGADAHCTEVRRINVSAAFFLSIEFQETGYLVYRLHQASFGAGPLLPKRVFMFDTQEIGRGVVVGAPGWEAQLESNKQAFVARFVTRPEFLSLYPPAMTPAEFIDTLNFNTGTSLTQAERDNLVAGLSAGTLTRAQAVRAVAENANFNRREINRAFVYMQYVGYLRRNPNETPDSNLEGYNYWLGKLTQFNGNFIQAEMVKAFLDSSEYRARFGQ